MPRSLLFLVLLLEDLLVRLWACAFKEAHLVNLLLMLLLLGASASVVQVAAVTTK